MKSLLLAGALLTLAASGPAGAITLDDTRLDTPRSDLEGEVVCSDAWVEAAAPPRDRHRLFGTVLGGIVGGVVGSQLGSGSGRDWATGGGVVAGAAVGRRIQGNLQHGRIVHRPEPHCQWEPPAELYPFHRSWRWAE